MFTFVSFVQKSLPQVFAYYIQFNDILLYLKVMYSKIYYLIVKKKETELEAYIISFLWQKCLNILNLLPKI